MKLSEFIDWCVIVFIGTVLLILNGCGAQMTPSTPPTFTGLPLSEDEKMEVSRQIFETNSYAPEYKIANPKPPGYYVVEVKPEDPRCGGGSMAEHTGDLFYDQTDSDIDREPGKVLLCFGGRFAPPNKIIITREMIPNRIVRFESEHLAAYHGNKAFYEETKHHTPERPHPVMGE